MIVRDEAHVIERCLRAARPLISTWCIVDTGSIDQTRTLISNALAGLPGKLVSLPWKGFAESRNDALNLARGMAEYTLFVDADDFIVQESRALAELSGIHHDVYYWFAHDETIRHRRIGFVRSTIPCRWEGGIHESLVFDNARSLNVGYVERLSLRYTGEGRRGVAREASLNSDILALQGAIMRSDQPRDVFYLALTHLAKGNETEASALFLRRSTDSRGDEEERWYADYQSAVLEDARDDSGVDASVDEHFARCIRDRPHRADACLAFVERLRRSAKFEQAYELAAYAKRQSPLNDGILVDISAYTWRASDEMAIAAAALGDFAEAEKRINEALNVGRIPRFERERLLRGLQAITERRQSKDS
jgi:glycosyltransferase involved in cell wall biosynthesis